MKKTVLPAALFILFTANFFQLKNLNPGTNEIYQPESFNSKKIAPRDTLEKIPDKLVVLTFDDAVASRFTNVRPILKRYGFSATFFITEGFTFRTNKDDYLTWEQIATLNNDGFEIGNHTRDHESITKENVNKLSEQIQAINDRCKEYGIPKTVSFAYPGNFVLAEALPILNKEDITWARRGDLPEHKINYEGKGFVYEPGIDDPLLIPSTGIVGPTWTIDDFKKAVAKARHGKIAVLAFHGVPDREHPWCNTNPENFRLYMDYLHTEGFHVIAVRDLSRYINPNIHPKNPWAVIERRKKNHE